MPTYDIYRIRVVPRSQLTFSSDPGKTPSAVLRDALLNFMASDFDWGEQLWAIADVESFGPSGMYFRIGRQTIQRSERLEGGHFTELTEDVAISTSALVNLDLEVCAIAQKTSLSPTTKTIANQLGVLLNMTPESRDQAASFEVNEIKDPTSLLRAIDQAEAVFSMEVTFYRPNFIDHSTVIKATGEALSESGGDKGKIIYSGQSLVPAWCKDVIATSARLTDGVKAKLRERGSDKTVTKTLKGGVVHATIQEIENPEQKSQALDEVITVFNAVGEVPPDSE